MKKEGRWTGTGLRVVCSKRRLELTEGVTLKGETEATFFLR